MCKVYVISITRLLKICLLRRVNTFRICTREVNTANGTRIYEASVGRI